jgi:hypothetical protein
MRVSQRSTQKKASKSECLCEYYLPVNLPPKANAPASTAASATSKLHI